MKRAFDLILIVGLLGANSCGVQIIALEALPPGAPSSIVVGRWGTSTSTAPPLRWAAVPNAVSYSVAIGSVPGGTDIASWTSVGNTTSVSLGNVILANAQGYYSSVHAVDQKGRISPSATSSLWKVYTSGIFAPRVGYAVPANGGNGTRSVALADVTGDGKVDLLATGNNQMASIFPGNGDGTFGAKVDRALGCPGQAIIPVDLNRDGLVDVMAACFGNTTPVFPATGGGAFAARVDYVNTHQDTSGVAADINGDGYPDFVTSAYDIHSIALQTNQGLSSPGTLNARTSIALTTDTLNNPAQPKDLIVADFNGDGVKDILVTIESNTGAYGGSVIVLLGNGNGTFGSNIVTAVPGGNALKQVVTGDFNGDGILDIAVANNGGNSVVVLLGNGDGTFRSGSVLAAGTLPYGMGMTDLNGDGILDLVVVNSGDNTIGIFLGKGDGTFLPESTYATGTTPYRLSIKDINGDGLPDIAVAERGGDSAGILLMTK
jgi:hypothetical protein